MVVLPKLDNCNKHGKNQNRNQNASLPEVEQQMSRKTLFSGCSTAGLDVLVWLKGLALDPGVPGASKDSAGRLLNRTLKFRHAMRLSNVECRQGIPSGGRFLNGIPSKGRSLNGILWEGRSLNGVLMESLLANSSGVLAKVFHNILPKVQGERKRKLEQDVRGKNSVASGSASENSNGQNVKKLKLGCKQSCSVSCLSNTTLTTKCFNQQAARNSCSSGSILTSDCGSQLMKQLCNESNASDNATNQGPLNKGIFSVVDSDELVCGSNQLSPETFVVQDPLLVDSNDLISSSHSSSSEEKIQQADRLFATESEGENLPRPVIPIGPKFQAEVPEWTGPINKGKLYGCDGDSEILKWLGTKIWPIEKRSRKRNMKVIGRGRPESCSCVSPGSADCIKGHTHLARLALKSDLGPAFLSWKFDEMGEVVSKTWTVKEQSVFESLVKNNHLSNGMEFWERALKLFPSKGKKSILSYYYNVFNPRRMSQLTRSSLDQVDSDEDQVDHNDRDDEDEDEDEAVAQRNKGSTLIKRF
ncbi:hypothetical protein EZV62_016588 [Acer yangbiense]|uniref:ELM2 domain-containing protein n=1 Tax=Acer yangbiense TaxID=1000413 RepID=A0A5C7HPK6_9ROSI|nr:hypothetical protein EZV62_016588 [Acer yangbiense]